MHGVAPRCVRWARPANGLQALAVLVDDVRAAMAARGPRAVAAGAGSGPDLRPVGPRLQWAVDAGSSSTPKRMRARSSRQLPRIDQRAGLPGEVTEPAVAGDRPQDAGVRDDHADTWNLVRLAQTGDGEAFGVLYDRYVDMVFRFIYYKVHDRALAEDYTSETFVRALRRIGTYSYQGRDIGAWFVTYARNLVLDHVKSARTRLESTMGDPAEVIDRREAVQSTETAVLDSLQSEHLMAAVNQLNEEQRECIVLRFVQGMSVSETAEIMHKKDGAIKALQHRAVRKLADLVGDGLQ